MSAFERETDMRLVGMQAVKDAFGDDTSEVYEELNFEDASIDAVVTRVDEDALEERRERGLDEPLVGDKRGIYEWVAREDARDPEELLESSPDAARDREFIDELVDAGFLNETDDGLLSAVEFPRHIKLVAVEFVADGWREASGQPYRSEAFTDEQWLVVDAEDAEDASDSTEWFETNGFGLAALSPDGVLTTIVEPPEDGPSDQERARALAEDVYAGEVF